MSDYISDMRRGMQGKPYLLCGPAAAFLAIEDIPSAISPPIRVVIDDLRRRWDEIVARG